MGLAPKLEAWPPLDESVENVGTFFSDGHQPPNYVLTEATYDDKTVLTWGFGPVDEAGKQKLIENPSSIEDPSFFKDTRGEEPKLVSSEYGRREVVLHPNPAGALKVLEQQRADYILRCAGVTPPIAIQE